MTQHKPDTQEPKAESGYEMMKRIRAQDLAQSIEELSRIADVYRHNRLTLATTAFNFGLMFAIKQIEGTEALYRKAHAELTYSNPKEAEREHRNQMNTLQVLRSRLLARMKGEP